MKGTKVFRVILVIMIMIVKILIKIMIFIYTFMGYFSREQETFLNNKRLSKKEEIQLIKKKYR